MFFSVSVYFIFFYIFAKQVLLPSPFSSLVLPDRDENPNLSTTTDDICRAQCVCVFEL